MLKVCKYLVLGLALSSPALAETGIASIYTDYRTASGERFDGKALTCAHRTRPLGSYVTVRLGARAVQCRIIDRGPYVRGRIIDLTSGAARALGISWKQGLARVTVD